MKYSDLMLDWLKDLGYTKCFFVAGGNIMHLLDSARHRFDCRPFVHEVAAVIAAEYFNEVSDDKAFALVTAGPGLTNTVSAFAGAFLESRFVLVIGGQVKSSDLADGALRQRGIQEIDGVAIVKPVTAAAVRIEKPITRAALEAILARGTDGRPGPVFLEICLDAQGTPVEAEDLDETSASAAMPAASHDDTWKQPLQTLIAASKRPVLLLGGGLSRAAVANAAVRIEALQIPVMTTWNGADRIAADHPLYFGRPNTWGQRYSNILLQQSDLIIALGTRLGLQQTGFNWQSFAPVGKVVQVDIDETELKKGHPRVDLPIVANAAAVFGFVLEQAPPATAEWLSFCRTVKTTIAAADRNSTGPSFLDPFAFVRQLSSIAEDDDIIVPCSSGGAFTVMMQAFVQKRGQRMITNKGLASMGYGLSGALGAALAAPERRVLLVEGDGGFAQNLQELGTVARMQPNLKIFIFDDNGYASIRMTQRNYFDGAYMGCDISTGLGLPDWQRLFGAYDVPIHKLSGEWAGENVVLDALTGPGPAGFIVPIDPEQTYFPKITSRVAEGGSMVSNPLHAMSPALAPELADIVYRYMPSPYAAD